MEEHSRASSSRAANAVCNNKICDVRTTPKASYNASLSSALQMRPVHLSHQFWDGFTTRVWQKQDTFVSLITLGFMPMMYNRSPGWGLGLMYLFTYVLKAWHLRFLYHAHTTQRGGTQACKQNRVNYTFVARNAFVITERLMRIVGSYFVGRDYDLNNRHLLAATQASSWDVLKLMAMSTGITVSLWQAFLMPTIWSLEPALLLPLILMPIYARAPSTAAFIAKQPPASAVYKCKHTLAMICSRACSIAMHVDQSSSAVCELEQSTEGRAQMEQHLVATLIIFIQYLAPLYIRYIQELQLKQEFIWPHLRDTQKQDFLTSHLPRNKHLRLLVTSTLHLLAMIYLLAISLLLGRLAVHHLMPASQQQLSSWWHRTQ